MMRLSRRKRMVRDLRRFLRRIGKQPVLPATYCYWCNVDAGTWVCPECGCPTNRSVINLETQ